MTRVQASVLAFIGSYTAQRGYSPSYDEIKIHMGVVSKSNVHRVVQCLIGQGRLRHRGGARSLEVVSPDASRANPRTIAQSLAEAGLLHPQACAQAAGIIAAGLRAAA